MIRTISPEFLTDLKKGGKLAALTNRIQADDTLMLALRGSYINVYYRGGSILHLKRQNGSYAAKFDTKYTDGQELIKFPKVISTAEHCAEWLAALPALKEAINAHLTNKRKSEREFQQLVAWENNRSLLAPDTEYFITDIEFADVEENTRLDMLGLKWLGRDRKDETMCRPVFIEMKYGTNAYDGTSGIVDHLKRLQNMLKDEDKVERLKDMISGQFAQLKELELVNFTENTNYKRATATGRPEVVFVLANHNPRNTTLPKILRQIENMKEFEESKKHFDLRFFTASFAGYGMHDACMLDLTQFKALLEQFASGRKLSDSASAAI